MSKIEITLQEKVLTIKKQTSRGEQVEKIQIDLIEKDKEYKSNIKATNMKYQNKLLFFAKLGEIYNDDDESEEEDSEAAIAVYSQNSKIKYCCASIDKIYKRLVKLKFKIIKVKLNKRYLKITMVSYLVNNLNLKIGDVKFYVDQTLCQQSKLEQYPKQISKFEMLKKKNIHTFKFKIKDILKDDSEINGSIRYVINIDGNQIEYKIGIKNEKNTQYYYAPMKSVYVKDFAVHIRRTIAGNLVLVQRLKEPEEKKLKFKLLENKVVSNLFYSISKIMLKIRKKKINLYYEKFSSKAEEGTYDLFLLMQEKNNAKNYFIISKDSNDYEKIKENKNVVKKYSLKYYWLVYNASNFISTEAPIHLNILRSNNRALRKSITDKPFIFLQHGVTYLKAQGKNSTFRKGKEGAVSYIVVGSEKEKDVVVESLNINEEQVLKTGLPIFSKIKYNHINQNSEDIVAIMLTWKTYEEQLYNFEESSYYKNVVAMFNMLKKYIPQDKIIIIGHPKANELLKNTHLGESLWQKPISEALEKAKLLITDYSSVCYNSFYQGGGVIFYQPDLEKYEIENGPLIPNADEYIGKRTFNMDELEAVIKDTIKDKKINLDKVRTTEYEANYKTINEFSDGKNIERIYQELLKLKLI